MRVGSVVCVDFGMWVEFIAGVEDVRGFLAMLVARRRVERVVEESQAMVVVGGGFFGDFEVLGKTSR